MPKTSSPTPDTPITIDPRPSTELVAGIKDLEKQVAKLLPGLADGTLAKLDGPTARDAAGVIHKAAHDREKEVNEYYKPAEGLLKSLRSTLTSMKDDLLGRASVVKTRCSTLIAAYDDEQLRKAREEQDRLRRQAEEEAAKKRQQELDDLAAAAKAASGMAKSILKSQIAAVKETPLQVVERKVETVKPADGGYTLTTWSARIDDPLAFVLHAAAVEMLRDLTVSRSRIKDQKAADSVELWLKRYIKGFPVGPNTVAPVQTALNALADQYKNDLLLPGVTAVSKGTYVAGRK